MTAIVAFIAFSIGVLFGALLLAVLGANRRDEEREEAYKLGFIDCMHGKAPKVDVRK
jgi:hypothetical protein